MNSLIIWKWRKVIPTRAQNPETWLKKKEKNKKNHEDKLEIMFVIYITDKGLKVLIYKKLVKVEKINFYERNGQEI